MLGTVPVKMDQRQLELCFVDSLDVPRTFASFFLRVENDQFLRVFICPTDGHWPPYYQIDRVEGVSMGCHQHARKKGLPRAHYSKEVLQESTQLTESVASAVHNRNNRLRKTKPV